MYGNRQRPRGLSRGDVAVAFGRGVMMVVKASVRSRGPMEYSSSAPLPEEAKCRKYCGLFCWCLLVLCGFGLSLLALAPRHPIPCLEVCSLKVDVSGSDCRLPYLIEACGRITYKCAT